MNCLDVFLRFIGDIVSNNLDNERRQFTQMKVVRTCKVIDIFIRSYIMINNLYNKIMLNLRTLTNILCQHDWVYVHSVLLVDYRLHENLA